MNITNKKSLTSAIKATFSFDVTALENLHSEFVRLLDVTDPRELIETLIDECLEGTFVECATQFSRAVGDEKSDELLEETWPRLSTSKRLNIAMTAGFSEVFSDEVWLRLFEDPSNTVHVRHRIVAGLVQSTDQTTKDQLTFLASRIGHYEDQNQQAILEKFRASFGL